MCDMNSHRVTLDTTPGLVATWVDAACSCGWTLTTLSSRSYALAQAEQHLDDVDAEPADFEALCSL
jgi:hypothetical protein